MRISPSVLLQCANRADVLTCSMLESDLTSSELVTLGIP